MSTRFQPRKRRRRNPLALGLGVVAILVIAGVLIWRFSPATPAEEVPQLAGDATPGPSPTVVQDTSPAEFPAPPARQGALDEERLLPLDEEAVTGALEPAEADAEQQSDSTAAPPPVRFSNQQASSTTEQAANPGQQTVNTNGVTSTGDPRIAAARQLIEDNELVRARTELNRLLHSDQLGPLQKDEVRGLLTKLAQQTIFANRRLPNDPLVDVYTVKAGDALAKIAPKYDIPYQIIQEINGGDTTIRVGQKLVVPRGPFHAKIDTSDYRFDLYLQDTYVRSFKVGLGRGEGTPTGVWEVDERLPNPTWYPPPSAEEDRPVPPGSPDNPLGTRWIGLKGLSGDAEGRGHYGIHGTNEPESIGQAVSLGCVRMHNEDVAFVFNVLKPGDSRVTIVP